MPLDHTALPLFTNLLILLVAARLMGELFERMRQPAMIGEIVAGIILGPAAFNLIHRTEEIRVISDLGVFLLVIMAGLEIKAEDIAKSLKGRQFIIAMLSFFLPVISGFGAGFLFGRSFTTSLFIGLCVAITALPVSVRILMDFNQVNSPLGRRVVSVAIVNDVLALFFLGVILHTHDTSATLRDVLEISSVSLVKLAVFTAILFFSYYVIRKISARENYIEEQLTRLLGFLKGREPLFALFFVFILVFATITENLGFHFIVGAFFASLLLSEAVVGKKHLETLQNSTQGLAMGFLAPVFFAGIGLELRFDTLNDPLFLVTILAISFLSKILAGFLGGRLAGMSGTASLVLGFALNARGLMELVIANIGYKAGLISNDVFSDLVIIGVVTTLSTPIALRRGFRILNGKA